MNRSKACLAMDDLSATCCRDEPRSRRWSGAPIGSHDPGSLGTLLREIERKTCTATTRLGCAFRHEAHTSVGLIQVNH